MNRGQRSASLYYIHIPHLTLAFQINQIGEQMSECKGISDNSRNSVNEYIHRGEHLTVIRESLIGLSRL